jgi:hypothetical protein
MHDAVMWSISASLKGNAADLMGMCSNRFVPKTLHVGAICRV